MYENFYQLRAKPFRLSPDPRFFFNSKGHKRALAYLRYGVSQGEGFIVITGDVGTGKTTLVSTLFKFLKKENVVAAQIVTTQLQADDLIRAVAAAYGISYQTVSKAELLRSLEDYFRVCAQEGKRVLLVVDEAQGLPPQSVEELRMLSNFQIGGRALLQSFLLGQKEFRVTLRTEGFEQLRQRVIAAYHLEPLGTDEVKDYIEHRLGVSGWSGDPRITDEAYRDIANFTEGIPRRINTLCDRVLLYGSLEELHTIDRDAVHAVSEDIVEERGGPLLKPAHTDGIANQSRLTTSNSQPIALPDDSVSQSRTYSNHLPKQNSTVEAKSDDRPVAVESSMESLASALREELALLRQALLDRKEQGGKGGSGEFSTHVKSFRRS